MIPHAALSAAVGRRIRELRVEAGIPLAGLARRAHVGETQLLSIEEGATRPTVETLARIAGCLRCSIVDLVRSAEAPRAARRAPIETKEQLDRIAQAVVELPGEIGDKLEVVELAICREAMARSGNQSAAARMLGIERKAFARRWVKIADRARRANGRSARAGRRPSGRR